MCWLRHAYKHGVHKTINIQPLTILPGQHDNVLKCMCVIMYSHDGLYLQIVMTMQDAIASSAGYLDEFMGWVEHWGKEMHLIATCIHTSISKQYICSLTQMSEQHTIMYSTCIA